MRLPPESILLAAKRWLEILPDSGGIPRAQALLTTHSKYGDLSPTQYSSGLALAKDLGLLSNIDSPIPAANRIMAALFEKMPPIWVRDADLLVHAPDELPSDIVSAGDVLEVEAAEIFEQLVRSWGKVDTERREEVGAIGEAALVQLLEGAPDVDVDHVSKKSDGHGYDISFVQKSAIGHLEVKSTNRSNRFTAYLSRHEYSVMLRDPNWLLVAVRLTSELEIDGVGWVPRDWVSANAPRDAGPFGSWASVKLEVPPHIIGSGIPRLYEGSTQLLPQW